MLFSSPKESLYLLTNNNWLANPQTQARFARLEGDTVVSPSGNSHQFETVLKDGESWFSQFVRKIIIDETMFELPDWVDMALGNWGIEYRFEIGDYNDSPPPLRTHGYTTVQKRVFGRVVQWEVWECLGLMDEPRVIHTHTRIYLPEYQDPGIRRQWYTLQKSGETREVSHEFAWDHIGNKLGDYTYLFDVEGMSQARKDYDSPESQLNRIREMSAKFMLAVYGPEEDDDEYEY